MSGRNRRNRLPGKEKRGSSLKCKRLAVPRMRERGLRAIARLCEQVDDKADAVLLDVY
jgi:hypothetical protein